MSTAVKQTRFSRRSSRERTRFSVEFWWLRFRLRYASPQKTSSVPKVRGISWLQALGHAQFIWNSHHTIITQRNTVKLSQVWIIYTHKINVRPATSPVFLLVPWVHIVLVFLQTCTTATFWASFLFLLAFLVPLRGVHCKVIQSWAKDCFSCTSETRV